MMPHNVKATLTILCLFFFIYGCAGLQKPVKDTDYYTLEYTPLEITQKEKLPITISVERFQISPVYDTDRLVFRDKDFRRDHYNYHRWRSNPRDLVTYYLVRDMAVSQLFGGVFSGESLYPAAYKVSGTVDEFYELDESQWYAVLSINVVFLKSLEPDVNQRVVFQKYYRAKTPCTDKTPFSLAEAMGKAMALISKEIILDIHQHVSQKES